MPERYTHGDSVERDHTLEPQTPPSHVVEPDLKEAPTSALGVAGMWYMLGPLLLIIVVIAAGAYFWMDEGGADPDETPAIGTIGDATDDSTPGGSDPGPRPGSTGNETEFRGAGEPPTGPTPALGAGIGQRVDLRNVAVVGAREGSTFWVEDAGRKMAVTVPDDAPAVRAGARVDVSGTVESDGQGGTRIRASEVNLR